MSELVIRHDEDRIAILTLDSPANRNALSGQLLTDLLGHLDTITTDATLHGVLLTSSQRVFCSGADLREAATVDMTERGRLIVSAQRALAACPVPVVCRVDGPARAGGLGLIASADIALADETANVALTEVRLGLAAAIISVPLLARVAPRPLADWLMTGRVVTAGEAVTAGLFTRACPAADLTDAVEAVLTDLRSGIRQGLTEAKRLTNATLLADFDARGDATAELSGRLFHSEIAQAAMAAALRR